MLTKEQVEATTIEQEELRHLVRMKKRADIELKDEDKPTDKSMDDTSDLYNSKDDKNNENSGGILGNLGSFFGSASSSPSNDLSSTTEASKADDSAKSKKDEESFGVKQLQDKQPVFNPSETNPNKDLTYENELDKADEEGKKRDQIVRENGPTGVASKPDFDEEFKNFIKDDKSNGDQRETKSESGSESNDENRAPRMDTITPSSDSTATKINDAPKQNTTEHSKKISHGKHHAPPSSAPISMPICGLLIALVLSSTFFQARCSAGSLC